MGSSCAKVVMRVIEHTSNTSNRRTSDPQPLSNQMSSSSSSREQLDDEDREVIRTTDDHCPSWQEMLTKAAVAELWSADHKPRHKRTAWRKYMREVKRMVKLPQSDMNPMKGIKSSCLGIQEHMARIVSGDLDVYREVLMMSPSNKVLVFLSSTFTDTMAERNQLMKDVFPFLRDLCRLLGLEFSTVDMRWGVKEEITREHGTVDVCLAEVHRCCRESCGPAFLAIVGNKYGYRPLPVRIAQSEFESILKTLRQQQEETENIEASYNLDENNDPPLYILKPKGDSISREKWNAISTEVLKKFQIGASALTSKEKEKYFVSVTEQEIINGVIANKNKDRQALVVLRHLRGISDKHHAHRRLIDIVDGEIDVEAQKCLLDLKQTLKHELNLSTNDENKRIIETEYDNNKRTSSDHVRDTCERICLSLVNMILKCYVEDLHKQRDPLIEEIVQNMRFLEHKTRMVIGRDPILKKLSDRVLSERGELKSVLAIHGTSGVGKTSILAQVAQVFKTDLMPSVSLVVRFIGTTSSSGNSYGLLRSVASQILLIYGYDLSEIPVDYDELVVYFKWCLSLSTAEKPLMILLDSVEQIYDKATGQNLKWLPLEAATIPAHTHIIVSSIPGEYFNTLLSHLPKSSILEIPHLPTEAALKVLTSSLTLKGRRITEEQRNILMEAYELNPFPLYMKMLTDVALAWRSYDVITPDRIAAGVAGMTSLLFERLEGRYGKVLVHHALGYITASKNGLSETELEDVLSCDDEVLDEVFDFWMPPIRRIPPSLWIRIRNDLHLYLMEKGSDGGVVYSWYHKQCREMAASRYLHKSNPPFREQAHQAIADYFDEKWLRGKEWQPKAKSRTVEDLNPRMEDRRVCPQPLILSGGNADEWIYNERKLRELPYNLYYAHNMERLEEILSDIEFIEAKFACGQGYDYRNELMQIAARKGASKLIRDLSKVVGTGMQHLLRDATAIYQLIHQQNQGNSTHQLLDDIDMSTLPRVFLSEASEDVGEDACSMTLQGHSAAVRCCKFSSDGSLIASTGEDGSLRIWHTSTGVEHVTVLGLPGPVYSKMADNHMSGHRPLAWHRTGRYLFTGSETGHFQVWDVNGAEIIMKEGDGAARSKAICEIVASPREDILVTCGRDYRIKIWSMTNMKEIKEIKTIETEWNGVWAGDFNSSGTEFVTIYNRISESGSTIKSGLNVYRTSDWTVTMNLDDLECKRCYCVRFSPQGHIIATGNDRNFIELWDTTTKKVERLPKHHHAYVRSITFGATGSDVLVSCADDYMVMVWDLLRKLHVATVAGHMNRVCDVSFAPHGDSFVTASRDTTLKLWDYDVIMEGRSPKIDGIPFVVVQVSPNRKYVMTVQGVNSFARIYDRTSLEKGERIFKTPKKNFSIISAIWSADGKNIILLDAGESGNFVEGSEKRASVTVCPFPMPDGSMGELPSVKADQCSRLDVTSPSSIAVNAELIAVGTFTKKIKLFKLENLGTLAVILWDSLNDGYGDKAAGTGEERRDRITSLDLHPSQQTLAASVSRTLKVWQIRKDGDSKLLASLEATKGAVLENKFTPDGEYLIYTTMTTVVITSTQRHRFENIHVISGHVDLIHPIAVCPQSRHLATASQDGTVRIWRLGGNFELRAVHYSTARRICFLDRDLLLVGGGTGPLRKLIFSPE